jgi:hypothetical protein
LNQIDIFAQELADNIVSDSETNPVKIAEDKYGNSFYDGINYLNEFLKERNLDDYPIVSERFIKGPITPIEFADFGTLFNITPNGVISQGRLKSNNLLFELERYYSNDIRSGALGGVCRLFETVFARADGFFNFIGQVGSLIASAQSFLAKAVDLETFVAGANDEFTLTALIEQIKKLIIKELKNMWDALAAMFTNFNISEIINNVNVRLNRAAIRTIMQRKDDGCLLLSEENKKTVTDKIIALFDYAVGLFDNPAVAEIQFLITRFCALISNVKALILDFKSPLDQFEFKYKKIANRLKTISNITSSTAIRNGAIRFSDEAKQEQINSIQQSWEGSNGVNYTPSGNKPLNVKVPEISEYSNLPTCSAVRNGTDKRIGVRGDWVKDFGMEGWTGLDYDLRVYLLRLYNKIGVKLIITYGWVSQQYNSKVEGDPYSPHISGKSVDISTDGIDLTTIAQKAFESGFRFVKVYNSHIHLDLRELVG